MSLFEDITDLAKNAARICARRHGMIEVSAGRLVRVRLRPWIRRASLVEIMLLGRAQHRWQAADRCRLYYTQPRAMPKYLAVTYVVSGRGTSLATFRGALVVLDEIARLRDADALVCDLGNARISDRLLVRWGWTPLGRGRRRQFIKRFYGHYPPPDPLLHAMCMPQGASTNESGTDGAGRGTIGALDSSC
jgi:hypothetical protein